MFVDRVKERDPVYQAQANKKTMVNLKNTFRRPPSGYPAGTYELTVTLEKMPGFAWWYDLSQDEVRSTDSEQ